MHITRKNTIHYNFKIYIILKNSNNYIKMLMLILDKFLIKIMLNNSSVFKYLPTVFNKDKTIYYNNLYT